MLQVSLMRSRNDAPFQRGCFFLHWLMDMLYDISLILLCGHKQAWLR